MQTDKPEKKNKSIQMIIDNVSSLKYILSLYKSFFCFVHEHNELISKRWIRHTKIYFKTSKLFLFFAFKNQLPLFLLFILITSLSNHSVTYRKEITKCQTRLTAPLNFPIFRPKNPQCSKLPAPRWTLKTPVFKSWEQWDHPDSRVEHKRPHIVSF